MHQMRMYSALLGPSSEISFSASGMKPPALPSAAPAPTIAIAGDSATLPICAIVSAVRLGSRGRRTARSVNASIPTPATTSTTATHVFGLSGCEEWATSPTTKAATRPIARVAPSAPT